MSRQVPRAVQHIATKFGLDLGLIEDVYPCTSLQASLFVASLHGVANYVSTFVFDITATAYSAESVKSACEFLYQQTPILRTCFVESKGTFLQIVTKGSLRWNESDNLEAYLQLDYNNEIRLGDLLAKFAWINDGGGQNYMVLSLHHALYDEWSINLLFDDLSAFCTAPVSRTRAQKRPNFSRFVKALSLIDQEASSNFWQKSLNNLDRYRPLYSTRTDMFQTSHQTDFSCHFDITQSHYQASTLILALWSIFVAKLSGSDTVVFGNVINGRATYVPGIVDICGPVMTTVPYAIDLPWSSTLDSFLDKIEQTGNEMLHFEQTGLDEYRRATGAGRFDTILSIRSSDMAKHDPLGGDLLRPNAITGNRVRHPCCLYLDVSFGSLQLMFNVSYDARFFDADRLTASLKQLTAQVTKSITSLSVTLETLVKDVHVPKLLVSRQHNSSTTEPDPVVDPELLKEVRSIAQSISPVHDIGSITSKTTLRELGLDSLTTVVLARRLSDAFKVLVPYKEVTGLRKTLSDISRCIQMLLDGSHVAGASKNDLFKLTEKHIKGFQNINGLALSEATGNSILLTGASGYVGIEILRHLLLSTDAIIVLLVRCDSPGQGLDRIRQTAKTARWQIHELAVLDRRLQIWPSDLETPQLGLNSQQLDGFKNIRTIIHNGARVDFSLDYHDLEATNVSATAFLLSQYLKSVSAPSFIYVTGGRSCPLDPQESLEKIGSKLATANGYAQTKFACEIMLHRVRDICKEKIRAIQMAIVHPGLVIGNEDNGVANTDDFLWRYVAASVQMQVYVCAVPTKREWINLMTVSSVASELVSAATKTQNADHLERRLMRSGLSVARFWEIVVNTLEFGRSLEPVSEWEWLQRLKEDLERQGTSHPLFSLSQLLMQGALKGIGGPGPCPENEPSSKETAACERAVVANVRYLEEVKFFAQTEDVAHAEVFQRNKR